MLDIDLGKIVTTLGENTIADIGEPLGLDRELDGFFAALDAAKIDYAVVLSAGYGCFSLWRRRRRRSASDEGVCAIK